MYPRKYVHQLVIFWLFTIPNYLAHSTLLLPKNTNCHSTNTSFQQKSITPASSNRPHTKQKTNSFSTQTRFSVSDKSHQRPVLCDCVCRRNKKRWSKKKSTQLTPLWEFFWYYFFWWSILMVFFCVSSVLIKRKIWCSVHRAFLLFVLNKDDAGPYWPVPCILLFFFSSLQSKGSL
jgi:hypothetical protein